MKPFGYRGFHPEGHKVYTYNCALPGSLCDNLSSKYQKRGAVQDSVEWRVVRAVPGHQLSVTSAHLHGGDLLPIRGDLLPIRNLSLFMNQLVGSGTHLCGATHAMCVRSWIVCLQGEGGAQRASALRLI